MSADVKGDAYEGLLQRNAEGVKGGAGETTRRKLLHEADLHTPLQLPTDTFYAQRVKANVLFFDRKPASEHPWTERLWVYDLRTNLHFTPKENPLQRSDLDDFVACFRPDNRHDRGETDRFRPNPYADLAARDKANLDLTWLKDASLEDSANLPSLRRVVDGHSDFGFDASSLRALRLYRFGPVDLSTIREMAPPASPAWLLDKLMAPARRGTGVWARNYIPLVVGHTYAVESAEGGPYALVQALDYTDDISDYAVARTFKCRYRFQRDGSPSF